MNGPLVTARIEPGCAPASAGQRVGRNVVVMVVTFVVNYLAAFATFPYLTRVLGPAHFGVLAFGMATAAYGTVLTEWGFNLSGPKAVVECRDQPRLLNSLIWSIAGSKACLCVIAFAALAVVLWFDRRMASSGVVILLCWMAVVGNVFTLYWLFQGLERFYLIAAMVFASRLVMLPLTFFLVHKPDDVIAAAAIQSAGPVAGAFISIGIAWHLGMLRKPDTSWSAMRQRLLQGFDMFVATASVTLFGAANTVILASLAGPYQVGLYAAADKLRTVGNLIPTQLTAVLYPRVSGLFMENRHASARLTLIGATVTVVASVASGLFFFLLSAPLTRLFLGGEYQGASPVLSILCFSAMFGNLSYLLGLLVLVPFGEGRKRSLVTLIAGCLNVVLALTLIPRLGAEGAAWSFLIAELVVLAAYGISIVRREQSSRYFSHLLDG
ncbi:flippase [Paraburkholderia sp.]|uniref:flippase n=1 Tax=Paraburkholderia sp. TaxID=1926495 RepID=UPI003D6F4C8B